MLNEDYLNSDGIQSSQEIGDISDSDYTLSSAISSTIEHLVPGDGIHYPNIGDFIVVHYTGLMPYTGKDSTGKDDYIIFDTSLFRVDVETGKNIPGEPFMCNIGVGQVIKGWDQLIPQMSLGEVAKLDIPSEYAYGEKGVMVAQDEFVQKHDEPQYIIPPNTPLTFYVELLGICHSKEECYFKSLPNSENNDNNQDTQQDNQSYENQDYDNQDDQSYVSQDDDSQDI